MRIRKNKTPLSRHQLRYLKYSFASLSFLDLPLNNIDFSENKAMKVYCSFHEIWKHLKTPNGSSSAGERKDLWSGWRRRPDQIGSQGNHWSQSNANRFANALREKEQTIASGNIKRTKGSRRACGEMGSNDILVKNKMCRDVFHLHISLLAVILEAQQMFWTICKWSDAQLL